MAGTFLYWKNTLNYAIDPVVDYSLTMHFDSADVDFETNCIELGIGINDLLIKYVSFLNEIGWLSEERKFYIEAISNLKVSTTMQIAGHDETEATLRYTRAQHLLMGSGVDESGIDELHRHFIEQRRLACENQDENKI